MSSTSNDSTWRHIALVYTASSATSTSGTLKIYVNGTQTSTINTTTLLSTSRQKNYFGKSNWTADPYFTG